MAFKINSIRPQKIEAVQNGAKHELNLLKARAENGTEVCVWAKPFKLSVESNQNCTITVLRTISENEGAACRYLFSGEEIYFGDELEVEIAPKDGYIAVLKINGSPKSENPCIFNVKDAVSVKVETTKLLPTLSQPKISGSFTFDTIGRYYYLQSFIKNDNAAAITAKITLYSSGGRKEFSQDVTIPSINGGIDKNQFKLNYEVYSDGAMVTAEFSAQGYNSSFASETFGNYVGGVILPDESSTTTTTTT